RQTVLDVAKFFPGEIRQLVRFAIAARQRVTQHLGRKRFGFVRDGRGQPLVVRLRRYRDDRIVAKQVFAWREDHADDLVAVAVGEFLRLERVVQAEGQRLEQNM